MNIVLWVVLCTLSAVFIRAYSKALERLNMNLYKSSSIKETPYKERPVLHFYNWLNEGDSLPLLMVHGEPSLE